MANGKYPVDAEMIVNNSDIVAVISHFIPLKKEGNDYVGVCPFHDDHKPSMHVSPAKKCFNCFACGTKGNVIGFVQKFKNISFVEALKEVAKISGIEINIKENPTTIRNRKYYQIMDEAAKVFSLYLNIKDGEKAREYLAKRNINDDVIKRFRIGLSNNNGDLLVKSLIETNQVEPLDLQELCLVARNNNDKHYYDLFRSRIMFPLKDLYGNIVGFSGRIYDTESNSKYMNSQENVIFKKSNILYNYSDAVNEISKKDHVIIFEGFMDVIAAYKAGVYNTLATMGTALTEQQVEIILKLTNNVTLCYDGDEAGIKATKRAIALFTKRGVSVKTVMLEDGIDPDDYLNKYGKEKTYDLLVNQNISAVDYLYNISKRNLNLNDSSSIVLFQNSIYRLVNFFNNNALKTYLFNLMSKDLNMTLDDIIDDYNHMDLKGNEPKVIREKEENKDVPVELDIPVDYSDVPLDYDVPLDDTVLDIPIPGVEYAGGIKKGHLKLRYINAEFGLIYLSYKDKDECNYVKTKLGYDEFVDKINRNLLYHLYDYYNLHEKMNFDEFIKRLNPKELEVMNSIINAPFIFLHESIDDYIAFVKKAKYEKVQEDIREDAISGELSPEKLEKFIQCKKKTTKIKTKKSKEGKK